MITVRVLVAVGRNLREIDEAFERIKSECDTRQHESLEKFKKAFVDYLWARCEFQTSVFKMRTGSGLAKGTWRAAQVARVLARGLS